MFRTTWTDEPKHEVDLTKNHVIYSRTDRLHQPRPPLLRPPLFCLSGFICSLLSCILLPTLLLQDAAFLLIPFRNPDDHIGSAQNDEKVAFLSEEGHGKNHKSKKAVEDHSHGPRDEEILLRCWHTATDVWQFVSITLIHSFPPMPHEFLWTKFDPGQKHPTRFASKNLLGEERLVLVPLSLQPLLFSLVTTARAVNQYLKYGCDSKIPPQQAFISCNFYSFIILILSCLFYSSSPVSGRTLPLSGCFASYSLSGRMQLFWLASLAGKPGKDLRPPPKVHKPSV